MAQTAQRRADLLAKIPPEAARVQVKTQAGKTRYKAIADLADTDEIQTNVDGNPIVMRFRPGRRKSVAAPAAATPAVQETIRRKESYLQRDPVLVRAQKDPESPDVLQEVLLGIGTEAASLAFERREAEREGKDTAGISTKRINALKAFGDTWLKRMDQLSVREVNLNSPGFEAVFEFIVETFRGAMSDTGFDDEAIGTVMARFSSLLGPEWENEAKRRMKRKR